MKRIQFRYYSKNKKLYVRFFLAFLSSLFLILFSSFMQISIFEGKKIENENIYGSWNAAIYNISDQSLEKVLHNQMLDQIGQMTIVGKIVDDNVFGEIGYIDQSFLDMSNIKMKKGRMPLTDNEIAVEALKLDQLGIDYTINQKVNLMIESEGKIESKEFILVGVVENYSTSWISEGELISFFVAENFSTSSIAKNVFLIAKDGYLESINELAIEESPLKNTYVEFEYYLFSNQNLPYTLLTIFSLFYSVLMLSYFLTNWTNSHEKEIQMLKSLGVDNSMLIKDFLKLLINSLFFPLIIFVVLALLFSIPLWLILLLLTLFCLSIFIVLIVCLIEVYTIPQNINSFSDQKQKIIRKPIKIKYKKQTSFTLFLRYLRFHYKREVIHVLISVVLLTIAYQMLTTQIQNNTQLKELRQQSDFYVLGESKQSFIVDFYDEFGHHNSQRNTFSDISPLLESFTSNKAISKYTLSYSDNATAVTWRDMNNSIVMENKDLVFNTFTGYDWNQNKCLFPLIFYSSQEWYYEFLKNSIDEGDFNKTAFESGEEIYIFLPKYTTENLFDTQGIGLIGTDDNTFYDENLVYQENTIKVGTELRLRTYDGKDKTYKIGGIIREIENPNYSFVYPYQIYVSKAYFDNKIELNQINLYLQEDTKIEPIESYYSKLCRNNSLAFTNNSQQKRLKIESIKNDLVLYSVIFLILIFIIVFTQYVLFKQRVKEISAQRKVFEQLGIENIALKRSQMYSITISLIFIIVLSLLTFILLQYIDYQKMPSKMFPFSNRFSAEYWSWDYYGLITIIFVFYYWIIFKYTDKTNNKF